MVYGKKHMFLPKLIYILCMMESLFFLICDFNPKMHSMLKGLIHISRLFKSPDGL